MQHIKVPTYFHSLHMGHIHLIVERIECAYHCLLGEQPCKQGHGCRPVVPFNTDRAENGCDGFSDLREYGFFTVFIAKGTVSANGVQ